MPFWLLKGRASFKARVSSECGFSAERLPYHDELIRYLREARIHGRQIVLATAANQVIAESVAAYMPIFDQVLSSDASVNLKGIRKLQAIQQHVGPEFVYAGDSTADVPIWCAVQAAIVVSKSTWMA